MELCSGTCPTANSCMLLDQQSKLAGCNLDSDVLGTGKSELLLTIALQVLKPNFATAEEDEARASARTFNETMAVAEAYKRATAGNVRPGLGAAQVISGHILRFFSTLYENYGLNENFFHNSPNHVVFVVEKPAVLVGPKGAIR